MVADALSWTAHLPPLPCGQLIRLVSATVPGRPNNPPRHSHPFVFLKSPPPSPSSPCPLVDTGDLLRVSLGKGFCPSPRPMLLLREPVKNAFPPTPNRCWDILHRKTVHFFPPHDPIPRGFPHRIKPIYMWCPPRVTYHPGVKVCGVVVFLKACAKSSHTPSHERVTTPSQETKREAKVTSTTPPE